ncbi:sigma-70 family RNA polymerase sigma factor [Aeromicrobium stalagmiti]|uniref:sigma-70 family RNA polymerase sigma factor n=1 Tax=Aeromicrobium stalagmiti TaxID=2738988 RepID=UPI00156A1FBE|nr:sigma-70 family RNA polymerase sigma factor [Aeromicrobium stalagmiti]NRQ51394.1 sigma-70 family RNA polymerase sigma factor [Aeromicrobium stalagmiti]
MRHEIDRHDAGQRPRAAHATLDDGDLLDLVRRGDTQAYAELYARHAYIAQRLARRLSRHDEVEDIVAQAFVNVLDLLKRGKGPDETFRGYLLTAVRNEAGARSKARHRGVVTEDEGVIDSVVELGDGRPDAFEISTVRAAYESLPPRWQAVIWELDVEGRRPHEVAERLGLGANAVSALVHRARSGLRDAYLQAHVRDDSAPGPSCADVRPRLAASVRETAARRDRERVFAHLATCPDCMAVYLDLEELNGALGAGGRLTGS